MLEERTNSETHIIVTCWRVRLALILGETDALRHRGFNINKKGDVIIQRQ